MSFIFGKTVEDWAAAIARRVADEWSGREDWPEDASLLQEVLFTALKSTPMEMERLIGSGIIEKGYFDELD